MAKQVQNVTWLELDTDNFSPKGKTAYKKMLEARRLYQASQQAFEASMSDRVQSYYDHITGNNGDVAGTRPMWSYRFGKVSIAFGADATTSKPKSMKL